VETPLTLGHARDVVQRRRRRLQTYCI